MSESSDRTRVRLVQSPRDLADHLAIRRTVFIEEQQVSPSEEYDGRDELPTTMALVLDLDGAPAATGRLLDVGSPVVHLGRLAVLAEHRGRGLGRTLVQALEALAVQHNKHPDGFAMVLDAQEHAAPFYAALGYRRTARDRFIDAGIWHVEMARDLPEPR